MMLDMERLIKEQAEKSQLEMTNCAEPACLMQAPYGGGGPLMNGYMMPKFYPEPQRPNYVQEAFREQMRSQAKQSEIAQEYRCRTLYEQAKIAGKERLLEKAEELRERREFLTYGICENSEGFLCKELHLPDGTIRWAKPICKAKYVHAVMYFCYPERIQTQVVVIGWEGLASKIILPMEKANFDSVSALFAKRGFAFQVSREYKKNLNEQVFAYLIKHMIRKELPYAFGWNLMSNRKWFFATPKHWTMERMMKIAER